MLHSCSDVIPWIPIEKNNKSQGLERYHSSLLPPVSHLIEPRNREWPTGVKASFWTLSMACRIYPLTSTTSIISASWRSFMHTAVCRLDMADLPAQGVEVIINIADGFHVIGRGLTMVKIRWRAYMAIISQGPPSKLVMFFTVQQGSRGTYV